MFQLLSMEAGTIADSPHETDSTHAEPKNNRTNTPQGIASHVQGAVGVIFVDHERGVRCHHDGRKNGGHIKRLSHSNFHFHWMDCILSPSCRFLEHVGLMCVGKHEGDSILLLHRRNA